MLRKIFSYFTLPLLLLLRNSAGNSAPQSAGKSPESETGTLKKLIVASGNVAMNLDLNRLTVSGSGTQQSKLESLRFDVGLNSFFGIIVFNNVLRGPDVGSMGLPADAGVAVGEISTLPSGAYTALLAGSNNGAGIGLVEMYDRGLVARLPADWLHLIWLMKATQFQS